MDVAQLGRPPGTGRLEADREWIRWGVAAAVTGMLAWVAGCLLRSGVLRSGLARGSG
jgi:hypothetical protein